MVISTLNLAGIIDVGVDACGILGDAENARPENDGQRKLWVWKMQEWKMIDKNYGVWKMQDWKMTDRLLANCEHNCVCVFDVYLANYRKTLL